MLAVNSDYTPTDAEANRRYFREYDYYSISGTTHYPMLENPVEFNRVLERLLAENEIG